MVAGSEEGERGENGEARTDTGWQNTEPNHCRRLVRGGVIAAESGGHVGVGLETVWKKSRAPGNGPESV